MYELLKDNHEKVMMELAAEASHSIECVSPYVKKEVTTKLLSRKKTTTSISLITNPSLRNLLSDSLDSEALTSWLAANGHVYGHASLHAKIYLFDRQMGIITSANLTNGGLRNNLEYGILFDNTQLVQQVSNELDCLYQDSLTDKLTRTKVNELVRLQQVLKQAFYQNEITEHAATYTSLTEETITNQLKGWKKDLFEVVKLQATEFQLSEVYRYKDRLQLAYPENNHIEAKIRQVLQHLRDMGLIEFIGEGSYRKSYQLV